jgi:peptidoglycan/LPS O-acetylase OafA/YrhL
MRDLLGQLCPVVFLLFVLVVPLSLLPVPPAHGAKAKVNSLEGLRGYLAFFVFCFHIFVWENYLRTGHWGGLSSSLHNHLGQSSVELFFMITGYLFWSKTYVRKKPVDWGYLYISRVLRIYPLYLFSVSAVLVVPD